MYFLAYAIYGLLALFLFEKIAIKYPFIQLWVTIILFLLPIYLFIRKVLIIMGYNIKNTTNLGIHGPGNKGKFFLLGFTVAIISDKLAIYYFIIFSIYLIFKIFTNKD